MATTFAMIQMNQFSWLATQDSITVQLWCESWSADPYGSRFVEFTTNLCESSFKKARKILTESELFAFRPIKDCQDARKTVGWQILNLQAFKKKTFKPKNPVQPQVIQTTALKNNSIEIQKDTIKEPIITIEDTDIACNIDKTSTKTALQPPLISSQEIKKIKNPKIELLLKQCKSIPNNFKIWYHSVKEHPLIEYIDEKDLPTTNSKEPLIRWLGFKRAPGFRYDLIPWRYAAEYIKNGEFTHA
jgi:hypothetical protein